MKVKLFIRGTIVFFRCAKVAEVVRRLRQKVWTRAKMLSPNIRYFFTKSRFVAIDTLCGILWAKKVLSCTFLQYHYLLMSHLVYPFWVLKTGPACLMGQLCVAFEKEHSPIHFLRGLAAPVI